MGTLADAVDAAEARVTAVLGDDAAHLTLTGEPQARAALSGWDIDFDEFCEISGRAGIFFAKSMMQLSAPLACQAAWDNGLLVGLMLGSRHAQGG